MAQLFDALILTTYTQLFTKKDRRNGRRCYTRARFEFHYY